MIQQNYVRLIGRITQDLELHTPKENFKVLDFSLATNTFYKDKETGEKKSITDYHNLSAKGKTAETIAKYAQKGHPLLVEGQLKTQSWEKDGVKKYKTFVEVSSVDFLKWYGEKKVEGTTSNNDNDVSIEEMPW